MELIIIIISYLLAINLFSFIVYTYDKKQAINRKYRVSEKYLLIIVVLGGMFGAILSMIINRHKIKKTSFMIKYILANMLSFYLLISFNQEILKYINNIVFMIE